MFKKSIRVSKKVIVGLALVPFGIFIVGGMVLFFLIITFFGIKVELV